MPTKGDIIDNPSTGASMQYDGQGWVPYYDKGMEPASKAESFAMGATQVLSAPARAVLKVGNAIAGRNLAPSLETETTPAYEQQMNTNPGAALAGQLAGSVPAIVGTGIAGAMAPATIAAQVPIMAGAGALLEPDHPLQGALMGVAGVFGGAGLSRLLDSPGAAGIVARVKDALPGLPNWRMAGAERRTAALTAADQAETARLAAAAPAVDAGIPPAPTMGGAGPGAAQAPIPPIRQMQQPGATAGPPGAPPGGGAVGAAGRGDRPETRMLPGFMLPEELAGIGVGRVTPAAAEALYARNQGALSGALTKLNAEEIAARAGGWSGRVANDIKQEQIAGLTNFVKREMGIPAEDTRMLTPTRLSDHFRELDNRFRDVFAQVQIQPDQIPTLRQAIARVDLGASSESEKMVKEFARRFEHDAASGTLSQSSIGALDRFLQGQAKHATGQGLADKAFDANQLRGAILNIIEDAAPPGTRETVRTLRRQFAIAATLQKPGVVNPGGVVNVQSLNTAWNKNKGIARTALGQDNLGRAVETVNFLHHRQTPSSGTTEGILQNMAGQAGKSLISTLSGGIL
jgi:hypothetical protein